MQEIKIRVVPQIAFEPIALTAYVEQNYQTSEFHILRRSIDARGRTPIVELHISIGVKPITYDSWAKSKLQFVGNSPEIIIIGAGPAGLFAALRAIEAGIKPVVFERGKNVRDRRRDLAAINKADIVNPESNYCFGEGGAGTYSDGKLYTRSTKRGDINRILQILVAHGAHEEILIDAHPHIGTNKLPKLIENIRESIIEAGGEVHFDAKVTDFLIENDQIKGVEINHNQKHYATSVMLATGHSARDIFELLASKKIQIEAKPFALGVRIEHPQQLIDDIQYKCGVERGKYLPAAPYSLVNQVTWKNESVGVYSFCMCPGGFIVPSATAPGEIVVNGMSPSRRDSKYANSGIVVSVDEQDFKPFANSGELRALYYQSSVEQKAFSFSEGTQAAPAQRMTDFIEGKISATLPDTSYQPGLISMDMRKVLPEKVAFVLKHGFKAFGAKMRGYLTDQAQLIGIESRTSSPVRIPRDKITREHPTLKGLYPTGEGAGFAGGIMSAAIDGEKSMEEMINRYYKK